MLKKISNYNKMTLHPVNLKDFIGEQLAVSHTYESLRESLRSKVKYDSAGPKYLIQPSYGRTDLSYRNSASSVSDSYKGGIARGY